MRILVTGSRDWHDVHTIRRAIMDALPGIPYGDPAQHTIVHGDARGADYIADVIGRELGLTVEPHPADWKRHGMAAGPIRNQQMVNLGADVCLAFPLEDSKGTWDCMIRADMAGIPTENHGHQRPDLQLVHARWTATTAAPPCGPSTHTTGATGVVIALRAARAHRNE